MEGSHLGCVTSHTPNQICINRLTSFLLFFLTLHFLDSSVETACNETGDLSGLQNLQEVNQIFKMVASFGL